MKLENMSALVTGGASGLGLACTRRLVEKGVSVVIVDLNREAGAAVSAELGVTYVHADVCNTEQINAALDAAQSLGTLRALVHCAGIGGPVRLV